MKFNENWLREWVDPDIDRAALVERLTMLGLEVDSVIALDEGLDQVVVGRVLAVAPHPNADRLRVCSVSVGEDEPLSIVCGAPNVRADAHYPTALVGARLPNGIKIRRSKIRGEVSAGMLCSAVELGLGDDADGILELDESLSVGQPIVPALGLDDAIIDLDLTPNRADCFSLRGIARDLGAALGVDVTEAPETPVEPSISDAVAIELEPGAGCGRFAGRVVRGIDPSGETPGWMRRRLERCGLRPIHPVVDVTNYVMLELGQPMHGYDLGTLATPIRARRATAGESVTLLDDQSVELTQDHLVIADGERAIGLAGIMGGASTAVSDTTTDVFLEAAFFSPDVIAGRARELGLHTDASLRFERGVDFELQERAMERATQLLTDAVGGEVGPLILEVDPSLLPDREPVRLRRERLHSVLGDTIEAAAVTEFLDRLRLDPVADEHGWTARAPSSRFDIAIEEDLIEEVARLYGYDRLAAMPAKLSTQLGVAPENRVDHQRLRETLVARGYSEVITYSFIDADSNTHFGPSSDALRLSNPISSAMSTMRNSLWPGLIGALKRNRGRQEQRLRLFEIGVIFVPEADEFIEEEFLSGLAYGQRLPEQWDAGNNAVDLFDIKSDIAALVSLGGQPDACEFKAIDVRGLRPGRSAEIVRAGQRIGWLGELHPALVANYELDDAPIVFSLSVDAISTAVVPRFHGTSKFPAVRRDRAVVVGDNVPVGDMVAAVKRTAGTVLRDLVVFDIYRGSKVENGSKSVALGLILQDTSRTLTDEDADEILHSIDAMLGREFAATIRE